MSNQIAWAVVDEEGIDIGTVSETRRGAVVNWLVAGRNNPGPVMVYNHHTDVQIEAAFSRREKKGMRPEAMEIVLKLAHESDS